MKKILFMAFAMLLIAVSSCKKENNNNTSETEGLTKVQEVSNTSYTLEIYGTASNFVTGYNDIYFRVKENSSGEYLQDATLDWYPEMHMMSMTHSCPNSAITKVNGKKTLYKAYSVFTMPSNSSEYWDAKINITKGSEVSFVTPVLNVVANSTKRVSSFMGTDSKKYIVAYIAPASPKAAINDLVLGLFTPNGMSYDVVKNFSVEVDPRMPSMGNHSSPNNENPVFSSSDNFYHGKLSLTMSGLWKLNLIVKNANNDIVGGKTVTQTEDSNLYLEVEF